MPAPVVAIFIVVYLGMILGGLPFLQLDRTGVALLGAIALVAVGELTPQQAAAAVHLPTLLLFSFTVISAQMRLGGFYTRVTQQVAALPLGPPALLAAVIATVAVLSNVVSNVPAVMLLLPAATEPFAGPMLALVSTLAGNLLIVGSIANIIVVDAARKQGIAIDWRRHLRTGLPVTAATLLVTAVWFGWRATAISY